MRVLIGSTAKMGAGTNVQNKLIASHDLDCPWRPSDLEQRAGRTIRQGNENPVVGLYRYVTDDVPVDIIARAEDASKIQRIVERFEIGKVDKAGVITQAEQDKADREAVAREVPTKTKGEIIVEEAMGKPLQKEGQSHENPTVAKTEKSPPSERSSEISGTAIDRGTAKQADKKPSVREKLERYKVAAKADKEADRAEPALSKEKSKTPEPNRQTVHTQPKKHKKSKER